MNQRERNHSNLKKYNLCQRGSWSWSDKKGKNHVSRAPECQTVCVNVTKVRWHKLTGQKSSIVIMKKKEVCSMCYHGKETICIWYDAEEKHTKFFSTFFSFLKTQSLHLFVTHIRNLKYLSITWLRLYKFVWLAETLILIYICWV